MARPCSRVASSDQRRAALKLLNGRINSRKVEFPLAAFVGERFVGFGFDGGGHPVFFSDGSIRKYSFVEGLGDERFMVSTVAEKSRPISNFFREKGRDGTGVSVAARAFFLRFLSQWET